jgi:hypothetical protein
MRHSNRHCFGRRRNVDVLHPKRRLLLLTPPSTKNRSRSWPTRDLRTPAGKPHGRDAEPVGRAVLGTGASRCSTNGAASLIYDALRSERLRNLAVVDLQTCGRPEALSGEMLVRKFSGTAHAACYFTVRCTITGIPWDPSYGPPIPPCFSGSSGVVCGSPAPPIGLDPSSFSSPPNLPTSNLSPCFFKGSSIGTGFCFSDVGTGFWLIAVFL